MLSHRHWTTFILLLCFAIACEGYDYGNDTSEIFDARDLEVRAGPGSGAGGSPAPHTLRIVAVGDIHGDYDRFLEILKYLEVVNQDGKWSKKVDVFVQMGNLMDQGPDTIKLFQYLDVLRKDAHSQGGSVYTLLGNHEVENLMHRWDFVNPAELKTFGEKDPENVRRNALTPGGLIGKYLANDYLGALLLPLYPHKAVNTAYDPEKESQPQFSHSAIAFVHAGLSPSTYKELLPFPTKINSVAKGLVNRLQKFLLTDAGEEPFDDEHLLPDEKLFQNGPLLYRGYSIQPRVDCSEVETILKEIGARRIVVGHTPKNRIVERCGGKIIMIDTEIGRWERVRGGRSSPNRYEWVKTEGGMLSALDIRYTFDVEGKQTEMVHAVYPGLKKSLDPVQLPDVPF